MTDVIRTPFFAVCALACWVLASACSHTTSGVIPVDSPMIEFQAPEADELLPDSAVAADDDDLDDDDDDDDLDDDDDDDLDGDDDDDLDGDAAGPTGSPPGAQ